MFQARRDTVLQKADKLEARDKRELRRATMIEQTHLFPQDMMDAAIKNARKSGKDNLIYTSMNK